MKACSSSCPGVLHWDLNDSMPGPLCCPTATAPSKQASIRKNVSCADVRKAANRVNFNQAEEEFLDGDETIGLGTLGARSACPTAMLSSIL